MYTFTLQSAPTNAGLTNMFASISGLDVQAVGLQFSVSLEGDFYVLTVTTTTELDSNTQASFCT